MQLSHQIVIYSIQKIIVWFISTSNKQYATISSILHILAKFLWKKWLYDHIKQYMLIVE